MKKLKIFSLGLMTLLLFVSCNYAKEAPRTVTVLGTSTVYVKPDTVSISFALISEDKDLQVAKQKNDSSAKGINGVFEKYKVPEKNIRVGQLRILPRYSYRNNGQQDLLGYEVNQDFSVNFDELDRYEAFVADLLANGIERIYSTNFSVKEVRKFRDEARTEAVKAAQEKAALLCSAASAGKNLKVGKVLRISEFPQSDYSYRPMAQNSSLMKEESYDAGSSQVGQIQLDAQVEIVFEIEN